MMKLDMAVSTEIAADQLWDRWTYLTQVRAEVAGMATSKSEQWRKAKDNADPLIVDALRKECDELWREYRVVSAWAELVYAVWIFSTDGGESAFLAGPRVTTVSVPPAGVN
jgi:hypothetical protein